MRQWHFIALSAVGMNTALFAKDLFIPILNPIAHQFHLSLHHTSYSITIFLLGMAISQIFFGIYSDSFGRKNALLIGLTIFLIANEFILFTDSSLPFMAERFSQGLGAGSIPVILRSLAVDYYQQLALTKINSYLSMLTVISPILAPIIGVYWETMHHRMWNFHLLSILTMMALILALFVPSKKNQQLHSICDIVFIFRQLAFWKYSLISSLSFSSVILMYLLSPYIFTQQTWVAMKWMGSMYVFIGIGYLIGTLSLLSLLKYLEEKKLLTIGVAISFIGCFTMIIMGLNTPLRFFAIFITMLLTSIASGLITPLANKFAALSCPNLSGTTLACLGSMRMLFGFMLGYLPVICIINPYRSLEIGLLILAVAMLALTSIK
jgi:MFS family permease